MMRTARVLITEDDPAYQRKLRRMLKKTPRSFVEQFGVGDFAEEVATTGEDAARALAEARSHFRPYDLMILDLELPKTAGERPKKSVGLEILDSLDRRCCESVVILTRFDNEVELYRRALQAGAADFVSKNAPDEDKMWSVARSCHRASERQERRWGELRELRLERWLLAQSCGLAMDRVGRIVSREVDQAFDHVAELSGMIDRTYLGALSLPVDQRVSRTLDNLRRTLLRIPERCGRERSVICPTPGQLTQVKISTLVDQALSGLRDGIVFRRLELQLRRKNDDDIRTYSNEAKALIEEALFSAIDASNNGQALTIETMRDDEHGTLTVRVVDHGGPIDPNLFTRWSDVCALDSTGDRHFGLVLAQRLATSIGGSLRITSSDAGNTVTIQLPVVNHGEECATN